jgi:predicted metal-dependent hydrolase
MTSDARQIETGVGPAMLRHSSRRTLAISVLPDGGLELSAPWHASEPEILAKVEKRRKWILAQRRHFAAMNDHRPEPRYVQGATHRYLGRQYRLKVSVGPETGVQLRGAYFHVLTSTGSAEEVRQALEKWFRRKAAEQFERRIESWLSWCAKRGLPQPRLRLLRMPKRWGSASPDGRIALNPELIHMPSRCIDYVVAHEICHLRHPHHGPQFFRLLGSLMPDWKVQKERMEHAV